MKLQVSLAVSLVPLQRAAWPVFISPTIGHCRHHQPAGTSKAQRRQPFKMYNKKKQKTFLCINLLLYPVMMKNLRYRCRKGCKLTRSQKRGFYSLITKPGSIDNSLPQMISNETHRNLSSWFALRNTEGVPLWIRPRHSSAQRAKNVTALLRELCTLMFVDKVLRWEWSCVQMMLYTGRGTT